MVLRLWNWVNQHYADTKIHKKYIFETFGNRVKED
tara:strand:+ start:5426 stop:5530 length:105 start_codon:yes stop_codon:yes gene_type:complete